jgi:hypothetical protein
MDERTETYTEQEYELKGAVAKLASQNRLPLEGQEKAIAELQEVVGILANQLTPLLIPGRDELNRQSETTKKALSPTSDRIIGMNQNIKSVIRTVKDLSQRLEV